jgi:hypothetical protein
MRLKSVCLASFQLRRPASSAMRSQRILTGVVASACGPSGLLPQADRA